MTTMQILLNTKQFGSNMFQVTVGFGFVLLLNIPPANNF